MKLSLLAASREAPNRLAVVTNEASLTYAEWAPRVVSASAWLEARGVRAGSRVALVANNDIPTLTVIHALVEIGATAILLHPRLVPAERALNIATAEASLVLEDAVDVLRNAASVKERAPASAHDEELPLAMMFTSGTSGAPKAATLSRRAFAAAAQASEANLGWEQDDRWLLCMPVAHVGGLSIVMRCLIARRCVVLLHRPAPSELTAAIERHAVTLVSLVPTMLHRVFEDRTYRMPTRVRAVLLGGAAPSPSLVSEARRRDVPILTTYGLTEACSQVTTQRLGSSPDPAEGSGHPVAGTAVRIVDGEIQARGSSMMTGYHGTSEQPFTADGWLRTGDFGFFDDAGRLHVEGRRSDLIVTGGENVYPAEIERVVEELVGVASACVFGIPDETWGQVVAVAIVTRSPEDAIALLDTMKIAFAEKLAAHKRPRRFAIVSELPITAAGKLKRADALDRFAACLTDV